MLLVNTTKSNIISSTSALIYSFFQLPDLKKVTSEMQTHKNPGLRTGPAPFKPTTVSSSFKHNLPGAPKPALTKPPVFTRDGKKWLVVS